MANIALRLELVLEQNFDDPDTRAVLGQVDTARHDGAGRGGSICRWAASKGERTGMLRCMCHISLTERKIASREREIAVEIDLRVKT